MCDMQPEKTRNSHGHPVAASKIIDLLKSKRNVDFSGFRTEVVEREIRRRMGECLCGTIEDYGNFLEGSPCEVDRLLDALTIGFSEFFRDAFVFGYFSSVGIPWILENKARRKDYLVRVWSAGCSRGEEAYTMAILFLEALKRRSEPFRLCVFGTDIDEDSLRAARRGCYPPQSLYKAPFGYVQRYFTEKNGFFEICREAREASRFSRHDLLADGPVAPAESVYGAFDAIMCRNVLMYMRPEMQDRMHGRFDQALTRGGYLVLGDAEEIHSPLTAWYHTVCPHCRVYRKT